MQSQYGWDDEQILDMAICRLRQVVANIEARLKASRLREQTIAEWQTKTLAQFIAATVATDKGKKNPLAEEAAKIRLRLEGDDGKADSDVPMEKYIEEGSQVAENVEGSYERLMQGFGGFPGA